MPLACIYSPTEGMRVVPIEEREKLIASGKWFRHPNDINKIEEKESSNEKQIRRKSKQRSSDSKCASQENGSTA